MLSVPVYDKTGAKVGEESIDPADFGGTVNKQLLHDVVVMYQANRRVGTVNTRGRADVAGSLVSIGVRDSGPGIPPAHHDKIFEPFFTTRHDGSGLGLAIAANIIRQHGGSLVAEHNPDRGMTFRIDLPLRREVAQKEIPQ